MSLHNLLELDNGKKIAFVCNDCGGEHNKWQGQCAHCGAWNTLEEIPLSKLNSET